MNGRQVWLMACCLSIAISGCGGAHERKVLVIEKTKTYHREGCPPVQMAKTEEVTLSEAKAMKFKACPICTPDRE
jgi:hypothetical protein